MPRLEWKLDFFQAQRCVSTHLFHVDCDERCVYELYTSISCLPCRCAHTNCPFGCHCHAVSAAYCLNLRIFFWKSQMNMSSYFNANLPIYRWRSVFHPKILHSVAIFLYSSSKLLFLANFSFHPFSWIFSVRHLDAKYRSNIEVVSIKGSLRDVRGGYVCQITSLMLLFSSICYNCFFFTFFASLAQYFQGCWLQLDFKKTFIFARSFGHLWASYPQATHRKRKMDNSI